MTDEPSVKLPKTGDVSNAVLLAAVRQLTKVVQGLDHTLKEDYPKRSELNRSRRYFVFSVVITLILSYFATVSTVSYCFLQGIPDKGEKKFCRIFPGYEDSFDNNREAQRIFLNMQIQVKDLQAQVDQLKK